MAKNYNTTSFLHQQAHAKQPIEWQNAKPMHEMPSPPKQLVVGHLNLLTKHLKSQHKFHRELQQKYGNIVKLKVLGTNIVTLYGPEEGSAMYATEGKYPFIGSFENFEFFRYNLI